MDNGIDLILQVVRRGEQYLVANENDSLILQWKVCRAIQEVQILRCTPSIYYSFTYYSIA